MQTGDTNFNDMRKGRVSVRRKKNDAAALQNKDPLAHLDIDNVASATDCTGLIPSAPINDEEVDAYAEICPIPHPKQDGQNQ